MNQKKIMVLFTITAVFFFGIGFGSGWWSRDNKDSFYNRVITAGGVKEKQERHEVLFKSTDGELAGTFTYSKRSPRAEEMTDTVINQFLYLIAVHLVFSDSEIIQKHARLSELLGVYTIMLGKEMGLNNDNAPKERAPKFVPPTRKNPFISPPDILEKGKKKKIEI